MNGTDNPMRLPWKVPAGFLDLILDRDGCQVGTVSNGRARETCRLVNAALQPPAEPAPVTDDRYDIDTGILSSALLDAIALLEKFKDGTFVLDAVDAVLLNARAAIRATGEPFIMPEPAPAAEVVGLVKALEAIATDTDPDSAEENYRADDREGCLDLVFGIATTALAAFRAAHPVGPVAGEDVER